MTPDQLLESLAREDEYKGDVILQCSDGEIRWVHGQILGLASPVLAAALACSREAGDALTVGIELA